MLYEDLVIINVHRGRKKIKLYILVAVFIDIGDLLLFVHHPSQPLLFISPFYVISNAMTAS